MPLSMNEIKARALQFSREWEDETSEASESQTFWNQFFSVFGVNRRRMGAFEKRVKTGGAIDMLWKGKLLVEHKSRGKDIDKAHRQAVGYFPGLSDDELPRYIIVSDFARFRLYDLDNETQVEFPLEELVSNVGLFGFISGYESRSYVEQNPVDIKAAERMGKLHDLLNDSKYQGHKLEVLLVRLLFCLFAEDTGLFDKSSFKLYLEQRTAVDGSDLGSKLALLFQVLDTPTKERQQTLDEKLNAFPHVNGKLFEETLPIVAFNSKMRETLLYCAELDWSKISPAIFGSLFQSIMDKDARRDLGAHYTAEVNILKLLDPLFLDDLHNEFENITQERSRTWKSQLKTFHEKLANIRILDPACGCGNFLVVAYRELRQLELDVLLLLYGGQLEVDVLQLLVKLDVDRFYGIEIEEFPSQIARTALWLTDHQMNQKVSRAFGQYFVRLPLAATASILHENALTTDWKDLVDPDVLTYIVGNPPFGGARLMSKVHAKEVKQVFYDVKGNGKLDYVTCWFRKATDLMGENPKIRTAFVSTNSIVQGEQVGILWSLLLQAGIRIHFAHRTFQWTSKARGKAAVHCVIIGFALHDSTPKTIFDYETPLSDPHAAEVSHISPYLVDGPDVFVVSRNTPLSSPSLPKMGIGNKPIDGGNYLFTPQEKGEFISKEPASEKWFKRWYGSNEFIKGIERWCLWVGDCPPEELRKMPAVLKRIENVRKCRLNSKSAGTRKIAKTPTRFHVENMPLDRFLLVPSVSSERRSYIPMGFMTPDTIASNLCLIVPQATHYHFGILTSLMHMAWVRAVGGRLKSDYRYSARIVYNNFPWPEASEKQQQAIEEAAEQVLEARKQYPNATMADLYDPRAMPILLLKAHQKLDKAVDKAYGVKGFDGEAERVAFLFERYRQLTEPLGLDDKKKKRSKRK